VAMRRVAMRRMAAGARLSSGHPGARDWAMRYTDTHP
jgi:hypothetical protein